MPAPRQILFAVNEYILPQPGYLEGVGRYARTHPYLQLHTHVFPDAPGRDRRLLRRVIRLLRPDGVLACLLPPVADLSLPAAAHLVNISSFQRPAGPTVISDHEQAGRLVAAHFLEQQIPHFAFAALAGGHGAVCRLAGFRQRLREAGHEAFSFREFATGRWAAARPEEAFAAWLRQLPRPVGIHTYTLFEAARIAWACQEAGVRIPADVALVGGQDNPGLAAARGLAISGITFDSAREGYEGLRLLDRLLQGAPAPARPTLIPPLGLVVRASSELRWARDPEVARARQWMRENLHRPVTVKSLLQHTPLSRRTLERRFAAIAGQSPHDELQSMRMTRARELLRDSVLPLSDVAAQTGFANYTTFAIAFRRDNGMAPSAFRRRATAVSIPGVRG
jgi:LacI family transcriptional regulator